MPVSRTVEKYPRVNNAAGLSGNSFAYAYRRGSDSEEEFTGTFHLHQGMEFLYIHEGEGELTLDRRTFPVGPGMLLYFQPFQLHRLIMNVTGDKPFVRSIVLIEPNLVEPYLAGLPHLANFFQRLWHDSLEVKFIQGLAEDNPIEALFGQFEQTLRNFKGTTEEKLEEIGLFFINFLRLQRPYWQQHALPKEKTGQHPSHPVELTIQWIEQNFNEEFRLDQLAASLHLSPFYLSRLFHTATGTSLTKYITDRRIREACLLLQKSSLPIGFVGQAVGFNNPSYFNQLFKKEIGLTPQQYRARATRS
jgi:AraC-like DNA-binding protein